MSLIVRTESPTTTSGALLSLRPSTLSVATGSRSSIGNPVMPIEGHSRGSQIRVGKHDSWRLRKEMFIQQGPGLVLKRVTIELLPNEVLLEVFQFYRAAIVDDFGKPDPSNWHGTWPRLVHVCRRWRSIIFSSPFGLDLQLYCEWKTPVRKMLNVWPALPLNINFFGGWERGQPDWEESWDNVIAAMECHDRVREMSLFDISSPLWAQVSTMMQESFPKLTEVGLDPGHVAVLPDTFLNGSAPRLQRLILERISFPTLPRFLLSTRDLTFLRLVEIPNEGYVSPEAMATSISALPKLEFLDIDFASPTPQPRRRTRLPPPQTRSVLSALTGLRFKGASEYLEVLAARIDTPILERFRKNFFNQLVFDIPQISRLIGNLRIPRPSGLSLRFSQNDGTSVCFSWSPKESHGEPSLKMAVLGKGLDWQVFSVVQICHQILPLCSGVEWLNIQYDKWWRVDPPPKLEMQPEDMDHRLWLELFHSFISVKHLEISYHLEPFIAAALQGLTEESATGVFPSLDSLSIVGNTSDRAAQQGTESFITSRQYSDHPVSFHRLICWTRPF